MNDLFETFHTEIDAQLRRDETVRWVGRPDDSFLRFDLVFPSLVFAAGTGIVFFVMILASGVTELSWEKFRLFPAIIFIPFIYGAAKMTAAPYQTWRKSRKPIYVLTDQRAMFLRSGENRACISLWPREMLNFVVSAREDGSGDIVFVGPRSGRLVKTALGGVVAFVGVPGVRDVAEWIDELVDKELNQLITENRELVTPPQELTHELFPADMRVLEFISGKRLKISLRSPAAATGELSFWRRFARRYPYISIDLKTKRYGVIDICSAVWPGESPLAEVKTARASDGWVATLLIAGQLVSLATSSESETAAESSLRPFVHALNNALGNRMLLKNGIFIDRDEWLKASQASPF